MSENRKLGIEKLYTLNIYVMAKKGSRTWIRIWNPNTGSHYMTSKNKMNDPEKLELMKYDKKTKKREKFIEWTKKLHTS